MIEWFKNIDVSWQTAIFGAIIAIAIAAIGGLFALFKWLFSKGTDSFTQQKTIHQKGTGHTAANIDGDKNIVTRGDVKTGIGSEEALKTIVETSAKFGRLEKENEQLKEDNKRLKALINIRNEKDAT